MSEHNRQCGNEPDACQKPPQAHQTHNTMQVGMTVPTNSLEVNHATTNRDRDLERTHVGPHTEAWGTGSYLQDTGCPSGSEQAQVGDLRLPSEPRPYTEASDGCAIVGCEVDASDPEIRWAYIFITLYVLALAAIGLTAEVVKVVWRHAYHNRHELKTIAIGGLGIALVMGFVWLALWFQAVEMGGGR
jgi:hypothetical protein